MQKEYVVIKDDKEKLEVIRKTDNITTIKNSKGQQYNIPSNYLMSYETFLVLKERAKNKN